MIFGKYKIKLINLHESYMTFMYIFIFKSFKQSNNMKKQISSKLTLGKRSVATLSEESMNNINGGVYSTPCGGSGGSGSSTGGSGSGQTQYTNYWGVYTTPKCC
jgi:hypothetical protein